MEPDVDRDLILHFRRQVKQQNSELAHELDSQTRWGRGATCLVRAKNTLENAIGNVTNVIEYGNWALMKNLSDSDS